MSGVDFAIVLVCWSAACGLTPLLAGRFAWAIGLAAIGFAGIIAISVFNPVAGLGLWLGALLTGFVVAYRARQAVPESAFGAGRIRS